MVKKNKILKNFFLLIASVFLFIVIAEIFVRIFYPDSRDHVLPPGLFEEDEKLGWKLAADENVTHYSNNFKVNYITNSFGFRDIERTAEKSGDNFRILLFGDSQVFGWGNKTEKRFSDLLENSFPETEIWNMSVPGYGLDQQLLLYEQVNIKTDAVIFFVSDYTLSRIKYDNLYQKNKPRFVINNYGSLKIIPPANESIQRKIIKNLIGWMYLPFFIEQRISSVTNTPEVSEDVKPVIAVSADINEIEIKLIEYGKTLADSRNHLFVILLNSFTLEGEFFKEYCRKNNIIFADMNFDEKSDLFIIGNNDYHWNEKANEIIYINLRQPLSEIFNYYPINSKKITNRDADD